jgi:hypothetical protein
MALAADQFSDSEVRYVRADCDDLAHKFVADDHRDRNGRLRPGIPFVNMKVGAADPGQKDADFHVIDANLRLGNIFEPKARTALTFYESFHFLPYAIRACYWSMEADSKRGVACSLVLSLLRGISLLTGNNTGNLFHGVNGSLHSFMDWRHMPEILAAGKDAYSELKNVCLWVKDNGGMGFDGTSRSLLLLIP